MNSFLYGIAASTLLGLVFALVASGLSTPLALAALAGGMVVTALTFRLPHRTGRKLGVWEWTAIVSFALFALRAFLWLVFSVGDEVRVLSPNNLGDLSLHLTYIQYLTHGVRFWPANPILAGTQLTYPLGVDLFHALIVLAGGDLYRTFIWIGLGGAALTGLALWRWGGAFTLGGFLCNGGLAGFAILITHELKDFQAPLAWKSFPLALLVTQRGLLFALPAGLALLSSWRVRFLRLGREKDRLPLWGEVLLYSAMPLFHLHTFIFLSLLLLGWFAFEAPARRGVLVLVGLALVPASILTLLVTAKFRTPSVIGWQLGWMQRDDDWLEYCQQQFGFASPWITTPLFWIYNFGLLPALVALLLAQLWPAKRAALSLAVPALAIFLLCCFVKFAPWPWDNTKVMLWSYLIVLPLLWEHLLAHWPRWQRILTIALLYGSGAISLVGGLDASHQGFEIARHSELDDLESALRAVPPTARIVAHPDYNHPLLLLGHPVALGYTGHVWSHGYDFAQPERRVTAILEGRGDWRTEARQMGYRYLFWGRMEEEAFPEAPQPWRDEARTVFTTSHGTLYDLESPPNLSLTPPEPP